MSESVASGKYFFGRFFVINSSERFFWEITFGLPSDDFGGNLSHDKIPPLMMMMKNFNFLDALASLAFKLSLTQ